MGVGRRETVRCARVVLAARLGRDLRDGMFALHSCDNPLCVRPEHIFEGTQQDNLRDMAAKMRGNTAKLTPLQRGQVRDLAAAGWVKADIARAFGITSTHVRDLAKETV